MAQSVFETTATALREKALVKLRYSRPDVERPYRVPGGMAGAWICSVVPTFWALLATVALIWPGFGVNWFGGGGNPNDNLAALSFSHQRLQYELMQIVPLAVIVGVGVVFYLLGGKTAGRRPPSRSRRPMSRLMTTSRRPDQEAA